MTAGVLMYRYIADISTLAGKSLVSGHKQEILQVRMSRPDIQGKDDDEWMSELSIRYIFDSQPPCSYCTSLAPFYGRTYHQP